MKKMYMMLSSLSALLLAHGVAAQTFTNSSILIGDDYNSGGCVGVLDMDQDGYDDILVLDQSKFLKVLYQESDGSLTLFEYGSVSGAQQWGMTAADIDNNGHNDVFCGGAYDGVHHISIDSRGSSFAMDLPQGSMFMQACNLADMNNDGWLDAFACNDDAESRIWGNNGFGDLLPENDWIDMATVPVSDNSGNYGSVWTDFDNDGDIDLCIAKCRQGVSDPMDPRRINVMFVNDGNGNFTEQAYDRGLVLYEQSWTVDFADVDNDGDFDAFFTNHSTTLKLLENDGNGYFTDITEGSGLEVSGFFLQAKMADFDNDGWVDLLYSGGTHRYMRNNGDGTFSEVPNTFPYSDTMHSFGIGDLNHDGFLDVYASYGGGYVTPDMSNDDILWMNDGNDNNWANFNLEGVISNRNAVGARIEIYGDFGVKIQEVRAGESYGITNTFSAHFGLGEHESINLAVIRWPSGIVTTIEDPAINAFHDVLEVDCVAPMAEVLVNGATGICPGQTASLEANADVDFVWSNGATTQTIEVSEPGMYFITAYQNGCGAQSNLVFIDVIEDALPEVTIAGEVEFCEGDEVTLIAPASESYTWSTGGDAQAITVTQSGDYAVTVPGVCGDVTSEMISVFVYDSPDSPVVDDVTIDTPGDVTFTGTSDNLLWYDSESATEPIAEGSSFTIPVNVTTTYWVEDVTYHGGAIEFDGKLDNSGPGAYHFNSDFYLLFDAYENIVIKSVKVYASGAGDRTIQVVNNLGEVVAQGVFDVPDGESRVDLNFEVEAGFQYGLKTVGDPQLWRNAVGSDLTFPYEFADFAAITGTNVAGNNEFNYYYFFYDWEIQQEEVACYSDRVPVQAIVVGINEIAGLNNFELFPNPVNNELNLSFELVQGARVDVNMMDATGRLVSAESFGLLPAGASIRQINVSNLAPGVYMLQLNVDGRPATARIIVE